MKEDFKQAMKRQVIRSNEPLEKLIIQFITQERIHILQTLMSWCSVKTQLKTVLQYKNRSQQIMTFHMSEN